MYALREVLNVEFRSELFHFKKKILILSFIMFISLKLEQMINFVLTVLPAKSDSDVKFVYKVISVL